jgi:transcriptional regulator with XRE-family HTH domain
MQTFGELLRGHRHARGWTQRQLGEKACVSSPAICLLERGVRADHQRIPAPSREMVLALAQGLGLRATQRDQLLLAAGYAPSWLAPAATDDQLVYRLWVEVHGRGHRQARAS